LTLTLIPNPKNVSNIFGDIALNGNTTTAGSTAETVYTCPAGKKAQVLDCSCQRNSFSGGSGAGDQFNLRINSDNLGFETVGGSVNDTIDNAIFRRQAAIIGLILEATDTINFECENGASNNGNMKFRITIKELPA
jgi:hypothetical protein